MEKPADPIRTLRFLTSDNFPPFAFRDPAGRITGFNVDLARSVCEQLDTTCTLRVKPFDELVQALANDEGDAIISGLAPTNDNRKALLFSDPYLKFPARFVVRRPKTPANDPAVPVKTEGPLLPETLAGKAVSVEAGTAHAAFLERFFAGSKIVGFDTAEAAREALVQGEVDAHFGDGLSLSYWLQGTSSHDCCQFVEGPWLEPGYFDRGLSIAVKADAPLLKEAIDFALQQVHERGLYAELYLRYFPISFY